MTRGTWLRLGVLVAIVVAAVVGQLTVGLPSQEQLRSVLDGLDGWAVPAFVAVYVGFSLLPAGPLAVLTVVGGALLGFGVALPAVLVGAVLGSNLAFEVSRRLGRDAVAGIGNARVRRLDAAVRAHGFSTVLVARLVPLVPFSTANYAFGLTGVSRRDHALATAIGIVPGTSVYVAVGAFGTQPGSWPFLLALAGLVLLSLIGLLRRRRGGSPEAEPVEESEPEGPGEPDDAPRAETQE